MRESGAVGNPLSSAMATIGCATTAVAALDKATIRYLNQLYELAGELYIATQPLSATAACT